MNDVFKEIRPYRDEEIPEIMRRMADHPWILNGISQLSFKRLPRFMGPVLKTILRYRVKRKLTSIRTVEEFQRDIIVKEVLERIKAKTLTGLSCSGLENIEHNSAYVYISNHRDITLDSAFLNYFLYEKGFGISEIAFGDNLLINDLVSDLIRVNRAFIVKRNLPIREQIKASIELSAYIWDTLQHKRSIWIAQREGRAKDGDDRTNPAILKMMYLSQRKSGVSFSDFINTCRIVPVSISYEFDPCDRMKAWELYRKEVKGGHQKGRFEDLVSMYAGITGFKGRLHYSFCKPLSGVFDNEKAAAEALDKAVHTSYRLWPSNYIGYDHYHGTGKYAGQYTKEDEDFFIRRFRRLPEAVRRIAYRCYGRPVENMEEDQ
ncbi:MAG: 1-acyl-sn-glycerol-3-phosphate acyltransferase [Spirochaetales bacterium]|nr:1-acyl-sn-glycerol-3-phosphate acyltransferase [Spirochaetales bacterium]